VTVDGRIGKWSRSGDELTVTPRAGLRSGRTFEVVARYDGVPGTITNEALGDGGVFHTDDGMVIVGQPFVASTWFRSTTIRATSHPLGQPEHDQAIHHPRTHRMMLKRPWPGRVPQIRDWLFPFREQHMRDSR
jgi:hypothetical protein